MKKRNHRRPRRRRCRVCVEQTQRDGRTRETVITDGNIIQIHFSHVQCTMDAATVVAVSVTLPALNQNCRTKK